MGPAEVFIEPLYPIICMDHFAKARPDRASPRPPSPNKNQYFCIANLSGLKHDKEARPPPDLFLRHGRFKTLYRHQPEYKTRYAAKISGDLPCAWEKQSRGRAPGIATMARVYRLFPMMEPPRPWRRRPVIGPAFASAAAHRQSSKTKSSRDNSPPRFFFDDYFPPPNSASLRNPAPRRRPRNCSKQYCFARHLARPPIFFHSQFWAMSSNPYLERQHPMPQPPSSKKKRRSDIFKKENLHTRSPHATWLLPFFPP